MTEPRLRRSQSDLAEMVEMLLEKGVVINADIVVSVGETELLGVEVRAAIASFETAAQYGLEFPGGTDMERVDRAAAGNPPINPAETRERDVEGEVDDDPDDQPPQHSPVQSSGGSGEEASDDADD